jgi:hypothetical protein
MYSGRNKKRTKTKIKHDNKCMWFAVKVSRLSDPRNAFIGGKMPPHPSSITR